MGSSAISVIERGEFRKLGQLGGRQMIDVVMESDFVKQSENAQSETKEEKEEEEVVKPPIRVGLVTTGGDKDDGFITF